MVATVSSSAPSSPATGQIWYSSEDAGAYIYYDGYWIEIGAAPFNTLINQIDAKGDLLVGTANDTISKLSVGGTNTILASNSATATGLEYRAIEDDQIILSAAIFL